uniref:Fanconi-associated nuclease n=1 Tax=Aplanochytrium stocchinoi TaxID=215587 RepID=A0A6S7ZZ00_9STRA
MMKLFSLAFLSAEFLEDHETWLKHNNGSNDFSKDHPPFLHRFNAGSALCGAISESIPILERVRKYECAMILLEKLLSQEKYLRKRRGRWYERLCINLKHLGSDSLVENACLRCLSDPYVPKNGAYNLSAKKRLLRYQKTQKKTKTKLNSGADCDSNNDKNTNIAIEPRWETIRIAGKATNKKTGEKSRFVSKTEHIIGCDLTCSIESLALQYFSSSSESQSQSQPTSKNNDGVWDGIHCEGTPFRSLFTLLLWDVIFDSSVPDVFQNRFQNAPLDLSCGNDLEEDEEKEEMYSSLFYRNRVSSISKRIEEIKNMTQVKLATTVKDTWCEKRNTGAIGIDWNYGYNVQTLQYIAACLGPDGIAAILLRMCMNYSHWVGGMPDLFLVRAFHRDTGAQIFLLDTNLCQSFGKRVFEQRPVIDHDAEKKTDSMELTSPMDMEYLSTIRCECMFVEVKGPNDRLSEKQQLWLNYLVENNIPAKVLKINSVK